MTIFLRCINAPQTEAHLSSLISLYRSGNPSRDLFIKNSDDFRLLPGTLFSYWAPDSAIKAFSNIPPLESPGRIARSTNDYGDNTRYVRTSWEVTQPQHCFVEWRPLCKGGVFSRYYADVHLVICWNKKRETYLGFTGSVHRPLEKPASLALFLRPGLTWSRRTALPLSVRAMPSNCMFAQKGPSVFVERDDPEELLATLAIMNSVAFFYFVDFQLAAVNAGRSYEMGVIQRSPVPKLSEASRAGLSKLAKRAWSLKRAMDTVVENSHAFILPSALLSRSGNFDLDDIQARLTIIQDAIDDCVFELYQFSDEDRITALTPLSAGEEADIGEDEETDSTFGEAEPLNALLSWAVGVAFGRFDWRFATGERELPEEPGPFEALPAKSPGMLPDDATPFQSHAGILVDDLGHKHDLAQAVEEVLARVAFAVPIDARRWLQREFFAYHLHRYSKSRRRAPIYWPLSTSTGLYTLWVYYPSLTSQTLYTAINDFVEPKLKQVASDVVLLRAKGTSRTRDDEKQFEALQAFEVELGGLRDTLLTIAPTYRPFHDDGVQISAAPLWSLFRQRSWQAALKETWTKLQRGDYDWAHLSMAYWPDRVRKKLKADKSLAITHALEELFEPPPDKMSAVGIRGLQRTRGASA